MGGGAVTLRPFTPDEFDTFWAAVADPDPSVAVGAMDPVVLRGRVATSGQLTERELLLAIEAGDRLIGSIQGYRTNLPDGVFGVGIQLFDGGDRGKGYGTAAVKALAVWLFEGFGARRLEAGTAADNAAMRAVLERVGFVQEGILRRWYPSADGLGVDCVQYGMTRDDYDEVKSTWI
jgi:RimJ/RimL family protein N-acetyltransferase